MALLCSVGRLKFSISFPGMGSVRRTCSELPVGNARKGAAFLLANMDLFVWSVAFFTCEAECEAYWLCSFARQFHCLYLTCFDVLDFVGVYSFLSLISSERCAAYQDWRQSGCQ